MLKKLLIASAILAVGSSSAFAQCGGPYVGASLGVNNTIYETRDDLGRINLGVRNALFNVFGGYGAPVGCNVYLGGEVFAGYNSSGNKVVDLSNSGVSSSISLRNTYTYGISVLPGYMLTDHTMVYARAGVVSSRFKTTAALSGAGVSVSQSTYRNAAGGQLGVGFQTALTPCVDLRGEYVYTAYRSFNIQGEKFTPTSDTFNLGLVYKFE